MKLLIFGTGRVGGAVAAYARHLGATVDIITHNQAVNDGSGVRRRIAAADAVAAAIPDSSLAAWLDEWRPAIVDRPAIHFSGALAVAGMWGYHPLYSFPRAPLPPSIMAGVAIAREEGAPAFASVLPGATNPEFEIRAEDRAFYHALAVLSGNFAAHLWNETAKAFADRFPAAPEAVLGAYLGGVVDRFCESPHDSLTGPIARRDRRTVEANLAALAENPQLAAFYRAFLSSAWPDYESPVQKAGA